MKVIYKRICKIILKSEHYLKNRFNLIKALSLALITLIGFLIVFGSYALAKNIAVSSEIRNANNLKRSVDQFLKYKLILIEVQADSFANNSQIKKLFSYYNKIDDFKKYSIDTAMQQYLNSISDTTKIISFILVIPANQRITPQLRGQSIYTTEGLIASRNLINEFKNEKWGYIPKDVEIKFGASAEDTGKSLCYFKFIGDKTKKDGVIIFGVTFDLLNEILSEGFQNFKDSFLINHNGFPIYESGKVKKSIVNNLTNKNYKIVNNVLVYKTKLDYLPLELVIMRNINYKNTIFVSGLIFLIVLILSWLILSKIIGSVKIELKAIGDYINGQPVVKKLNLLSEFYSTIDEMILIQKNINRENIEVIKELNHFIELSLININSMFDTVREIESELKSIEGIWLKIKELFLNISESINKMQMNENRFANKFYDNVSKTQFEIQIIKESLSKYTIETENILKSKNLITNKLRQLSEQIEQLKELKKFKEESLLYIEQLDIISLNAMIKTAKDETNKVLNTISQQLIFQNRLLKNNLVYIDNCIKKILEISLQGIFSQNAEFEGENFNFEKMIKEADIISNRVVESINDMQVKIKEQKSIMQEIIKEYNFIKG